MNENNVIVLIPYLIFCHHYHYIEFVLKMKENKSENNVVKKKSFTNHFKITKTINIV